MLCLIAGGIIWVGGCRGGISRKPRWATCRSGAGGENNTDCLGAAAAFRLPIAFLPHSLWWLVLGVVILDFAVQAVHVTNQSIIFALRPDAQSRLVAGYMLFYSIGSAIGAIATTWVFAHAGWSGVCMLGATISAVAILFLHLTYRKDSTCVIN